MIDDNNMIFEREKNLLYSTTTTTKILYDDCAVLLMCIFDVNNNKTKIKRDKNCLESPDELKIND